jgi:transcriptional regulator with XRE-family HTH domain
MSPAEFKAAREALGFTITDLGEWLGLEMPNGRTMIREMESGKRSISGPIRRALRVASAGQAVLDHCTALDDEEAQAIARLAEELDIVESTISQETHP